MIGDNMNSLRASSSLNNTSNHATYIMSSSFRVLDNHSLYYAYTHYESINIVLYRKREDETQNSYFDAFVKDLMKTLEQFGDVSIIYDYKDIKFNNDVILDKAYLQEEKELEAYIKSSNKYSTISVESNVVVPVVIASNKEEYSARTIRPKIHKHLFDFIDPVLEDFEHSSKEQEALNHVIDFIKTKLPYYDLKNHPEHTYTSDISGYLKYGIISPIRILILLDKSKHFNKASFIEELVVRRELAYNFVYYNNQYYDFNHMTYEWAYLTMKVHQLDHKEYLYTLADYINFNTHDIYFNAAMKEMVHLGKMHGYMRMYWCKKIIEWSPNFKYAYDTAIALNNRYFLDGNSPNGYAGVAWCFGKHDRAWNEREIFGKLRYMNANGLKRKFKIEQYIERIESEVKAYESSKAKNIN